MDYLITSRETDLGFLEQGEANQAFEPPTPRKSDREARAGLYNLNWHDGFDFWVDPLALESGGRQSGLSSIINLIQMSSSACQECVP